jgi:cyclopropane-fatty-acyl-phospholipid synthase
LVIERNKNYATFGLLKNSRFPVELPQYFSIARTREDSMARPISSEKTVSARQRSACPTVVSFPQFSRHPHIPAVVADKGSEVDHCTHETEVTNPDAQSPSPAVTSQKSSSVTALERWICNRLLKAIGGQAVGIVLFSGEEISLRDHAPIVRLAFRDRSTLFKLLFDPEWEFGEAYSEGRLEIDGSLRELLDLFYRAGQHSLKHGKRFSLAKIINWRHWRHANSISESRDNIHHHYDIGNDFYRLWLDERMVYSCAYFAEPSMTLDQAQEAKIEHVCHKLRLRPGETVVEVGGGWGALAMHIAKHYGCRVKSFNICREQIDFARYRVRSEGLNGRVDIIADDYRNIAGRFDALVSLGMLEHVGREHYREFGKMADRCLTEHGRALIQTIGQNQPNPNNSWIEGRIFPGGHIPTLREFMDLVEPGNFSIVDVENLRLHYAKTLECWLARFEAAAEKVRQKFDERFVRMWRLYLTGSAAAFASSTLQLYQILFNRGEKCSDLWTRSDWYR